MLHLLGNDTTGTTNGTFIHLSQFIEISKLREINKCYLSCVYEDNAIIYKIICDSYIIFNRFIQYNIYNYDKIKTRYNLL